MSLTKKMGLDYQINQLGFWAALMAITTGAVAIVLPLDAPGGYAAEHADRVAWLSANRGTFILGWINQIVAMLSLSAVFFGAAWRIAERSPLRAIVAAMVVFLSVVAFIIPKFIAIWTIPLLAETISSQAMGIELADTLLRLLNVSVPFSLYTSFDYLGFWLYAVFGLFVAGPLCRDTMSSKVAGVTAGVFGLAYHALLVALLLGTLAATDIEAWFLGASSLLLIMVMALLLSFRGALRLEP